LYSFKLSARPDGELLVDHLKDVADISLERFQSIKHNLESILPQKILENLVYITGFSHDFGKATSFFQDYLKADETQKEKLRNHPETHHGLLSAVFTYWLIKSYFNKVKIPLENPLVPFLPFLFFLMVKRHHGNLGDPIKEELYSAQFDYLNKQKDNLNKEELGEILNLLSNKINIEYELSDFPDDVEEYCKTEFLKGVRRKLNFKRKFPQNIASYTIFQFFYSILLYADKESVILGTKNGRRQKINSDIITKYKNEKFEKPQSEIDKIREKIFSDADEIIKKAGLDNKIFSLNVPTGTGKTLTSLHIALKIRERLEKEKNFTPRIIYCLPFTSIIDQNYDILQEVFNNPSSDILLKHHYLSDVVYKTNLKENGEYDTEKSQFLIESWESEIIVTTFVQLFHTLLTNKNRSLKKFHKLSNAVILLDEVQTIPIKYWLLIRNIFKTLTEYFNSYVILITATQPRIFKETSIVELVPQKQNYFNKLNRVNLNFLVEDLDLDAFNNLIYEEINHSDESFLIVLNTINSSLKVYEFLKEMNIDTPVYYLSTNIIPKERLERIKHIKEKKERKIIVSTQLVEAGVDIDVENVWRDFGPLDSINQVSGRCNRNFNEKLGNVIIFQLKNDDGKYFYRHIYGDSVLSIIETKSAFGNKRKFDEREFLENIDGYYKRIEAKMSNVDSENIIENVNQLKFNEISKFKLIEEKDYYKKDVFIEIDDNAKKIWSKFIEIRKLPLFERKTEFLNIKKEFYDYVISVPKTCVPEEEFENTGIVYVDNSQVDSCYNFTTGWKRDNESLLF